MEDYQDLDNYNGDNVHDMWVDFDNFENTGSPDVFDEEDSESLADSSTDCD